jgi:dUTPase
MKVYIKYFVKDITPVEKIEKGDWIDLRAAETVEMKAGDCGYIRLGVGMILPEGYEAHVAPRSSTFKNFGILVSNSFGIIDNSFCGEEDEWRLPVYAARDTLIRKNDRICQFRIEKRQPDIIFEEVDHLDDTDRGGFGSTGIQ